MKHCRRPDVLAFMAVLAALLLPGALMAAGGGAHARTQKHVLFPPEVMGQIKALVEAKKLDLRFPPHVAFELPATRMVEKQLVLAGVHLAKGSLAHAAEDLCYENVYWNGGPAMASATSGTAMIWGSELGLYFAKASDPVHPTEFSLGDVPLHITINGNQAFIHGLWYSYLFDVSDPGHPAFVSLLDWAGAWNGWRAFAWSPDGKTMAGINDDWLFGGWGGGSIVFFDAATFAVQSAFFIGDSFAGPGLSDVVIPSNPGTVAVVSGGVIADPNGAVPQPALYFIDFSGIDCQTPPTLLAQVDCSADGVAGSLLYVEPYLYVNKRPFWSYNPTINSWFYSSLSAPLPPPDEAMTVDIYSLPAASDPGSLSLIKTFTRNGDDPIAWTAAQDRSVVIGSYQDHVLQMTPLFDALVASQTLGDYAGSGGTQVMFDMGYAPSANGGPVACGTRGARFYTMAAGETGHFWTGGTSQNPVVVGSSMLVPSGSAGLAILDVSNPASPVDIGWLEGPAVTLAAPSSDSSRAFVSDGTAKVWAVDITDKTKPVSIANSTYVPSAPVQALLCDASRPILYVGTAAGLEIVDYSAPSSPLQLKVIPAAGTGGVRDLKPFAPPAYPSSTLVVAAEFDTVEVFDVTGPGQTPGVDYYSVTSLAMAPYGVNDGVSGPPWVTIPAVACNWIAANGSFIYVLDSPPTDWVNSNFYNSYLRPVVTTAVPGPPPLALTLSSAGTAPLGATADNYNLIWQQWSFLGSLQPGILFGGMSQFGAPATFDVGTNPLAPTLAPPTTWSFPAFVTNNGNAILTGIAVSSGWVWCSGGDYGVMGESVQPGWQDITIVSADASPKAPGPSGSTLLQGATIFSATVQTADAPCRMVKLYWGPISEIWVGDIPPHTTKTLTWTEDLDTLSGEAASAACGNVAPIYVTATTSAQTECSIYATYDSVGMFTTNVPPYAYGFSNVTPAPPSVPYGCPDNSSYVVCGPIAFNIWWGDCTANIDLQGNPATGITQVALFVDGKVANYVDNPDMSDYVGPQFTIDPVALDLADGLHGFHVQASDVVGKNGSTPEVAFVLHTQPPSVILTAPGPGQAVAGSAVRVAATATSSAGLAMQKVEFYLDSNPANTAPNGQLVGTATATDAAGEYAIAWDSTSMPLGAHTVAAWAYEAYPDGVTESCVPYGKSPLVSFTLAPPPPMTVTATASPTSGSIPLSVSFNASIAGGTPPYSVSWNFGDGSTGTGTSAVHTYTSAGSFTATATVTDSASQTATATAAITASSPPVITAVSKLSDPFRLKVLGANFHAVATILIDGIAVPETLYKSSGELLAKKGTSLKDMVPAGVTVAITVRNNDDGGISAPFNYAR